MSTIQELESLWSEYFSSPFPKSSAPFWTKYSPPVVRHAFETLRRKSRSHKFETLGDVCRFATGIMRSYDSDLLPAPELRSESQAGA